MEAVQAASKELSKFSGNEDIAVVHRDMRFETARASTKIKVDMQPARAKKRTSEEIKVEAIKPRTFEFTSRMHDI